MTLDPVHFYPSLQTVMPTSKDKSPDDGPVFSGVRTKDNSGARVQRASTIAPFGYLTPEEEFGDVVGGSLDVAKTAELTKQ